MTFRDLLPGQRFVFVDVRGDIAMRWGRTGPWVKVGPGKFIHHTHAEEIFPYKAAYTTRPNARVRAVKEETQID